MFFRFFVCLFFLPGTKSSRGEKRGKYHRAFIILWIFGLGDGHTQCMKKSLFNPSNSTVLLQDSLVKLFFHALSCSIAMCPHSFLLPNMESLPSFSFELSAPPRQARWGGALWMGVGGTLLPECQHPHMYIGNEHICIHSLPPKKTQYNIPHWCAHTRTRTHNCCQSFPSSPPLRPLRGFNCYNYISISLSCFC